jgi:hypothetical protein
MKMNKLLKVVVASHAGAVIDRLGLFKSVFTLSSLLYCSIHWLGGHNFSVPVFSGALVVGGIAATAAAWLSKGRSLPLSM